MTPPVFNAQQTDPQETEMTADFRVWKARLLGAVRQHGIGMIREDADQMPAVFYLRERGIAREYRYKTIADRPDYLRLIG